MSSKPGQTTEPSGCPTAPRHSQQLYEERKYFKYIPHLSYMFDHYPAPGEFMECTKTTYLPQVRQETLRGEERTRTYLGCPYAAGPNSSGLPGACATRHSPERPQGCSDLHEDCLSLQQPSQTENTQVKFKPPAQPSSLATPAPCLPCCAQGCNFFSCHLTALKTRADQQPDAKKEQVKKLIYLLRQVA